MTDLRPLTPRECLDRLASQAVGRLAFSEHALPTVRPVNFVLHHGDIVVRTSAAGAIGRLSGEVVAFEVDDVEPAPATGWSVVVVGKAEAVTDAEELATLAGPRHPLWAHGERSRFLRIPIDMISGRMLRLAVADPVPGAAAS
ncbi:nitroimidazol reductase NimA-like FMN-containing flavoprotein (pyridoxamine 5'-phosphate oxidase superfamily) [Amycolatopsis bartoniae]|uniref:Pyridoxamine 5'-phosphate oxidase family protein n=1 Tax=Amycolatopsis bartoniae TaxID=941986 RepID=A0A8H9IVA6_9PSEU|nr:pyridoxamine 5'-phosphate oxidase family protein [Amycolatopsis bartoniae]MBB2937111.1 nitroimidazol reductase NimA-like FMN-containing flavoprotein (pyridoxamine 5'-phosphate oxidase superfamily) [Amycolatopsis bartoniae]TVS98813.1 pyridoxamine 5'-phosphate oxidase family protein [Amycolatopsis bartoniae]GHF52506.1 hypothetical protein GCM10017566_27340 [Amycolatopsis bartoniae]